MFIVLSTTPRSEPMENGWWIEERLVARFNDNDVHILRQYITSEYTDWRCWQDEGVCLTLDELNVLCLQLALRKACQNGQGGIKE